jgi:hypothetical protein
MAVRGLELCVASYTEPGTAMSDLRRLEHLLDDGHVMAGPVALHRDRDGRVSVVGPDHRTIPKDDLTAEDVGLVIGLLVPELLLSSAIVWGVDATVRSLIRRHEEGHLGVDLHDHLPPGGSMIAAIVPCERHDRACRALTRPDRIIEAPVDPSDRQAIRSALTEARRQAHGTHAR